MPLNSHLRTPSPHGLAPMLAVAGPLPAQDGGWAYEVKWDGVRVLASLAAGSLTLTSRNGNDVTAAYPELAALAAGHDALVDGELVALDAQGRPDFGALQTRMHVRRPSAGLVRSTPVTLVAFDLLHAGDRPLLDLPYDERRARLFELALPAPAHVPEAFTGDGGLLADATRAQGLEGVVAKRRDSRYEPGRRSSCWVKVKHVRRTSAVVVGWKPGEGGRAGRIGSLLLALPVADGGWTFAGHVGTGFSAATLALLGERLQPLRRETPAPPDVPREHARTAVWVEPELVCDVDYTEWTREGRLRHPSYKGLRDDLDPRGVVRQ